MVSIENSEYGYKDVAMFIKNIDDVDLGMNWIVFGGMVPKNEYDVDEEVELMSFEGDGTTHFKGTVSTIVQTHYSDISILRSGWLVWEADKDRLDSGDIITAIGVFVDEDKTRVREQ